MKGGLREVVSTGVVFVQQAGIVTALADTAWDTSAILSDTSLFGRVLHTLVGYSDQPSVSSTLSCSSAVLRCPGRSARKRRHGRESPQRNSGLQRVGVGTFNFALGESFRSIQQPLQQASEDVAEDKLQKVGGPFRQGG